MTMQFLGVGSQCDLSANSFHSNVLLSMSSSERALLIDCGSDVKHSLSRVGLNYDIITDVYISHLHSDHVGGLEWLCFLKRYDSDSKKKLRLWIEENLSYSLWENTLKGGLNYLTDSKSSLEVFFDVNRIAKGGNFEFESATFTLVPIVHIEGPSGCMPCYGLCIEYAGHKIFFSSDTQYNDGYLQQYYDWADVIFHDCDTALQSSSVHAHYDQLCMLETDVKAKMWLYHYTLSRRHDAERDGFCGFVVAGQKFEFSK